MGNKTMKLQHIPLSQLKVSPVNVRKRGADEDLGELIASIRSLGVIQPLLVRPNCEGYEVVAGQRRLLACQALQAETGSVAPLPCALLESGDDAVALEASLAENVARLPMDEIDQYEAFAALLQQGRSIADIAHQFGVTELLVKRRLAISALIPQILNAYRDEEIEPETMQQLTLATAKQQKAWFRLFKNPKEHAPTGRRLKAWLFGAEIPVSSAIFPPERYPGNIVSDLFGEDDDAEKFWKLQMEAVIHRQAVYLEEGWSNVIILEVGAAFYQYDKVKRGKAKGGAVYISCAGNGEIGFHEGWLDSKEAARRDKASEKSAQAGQEAEKKASAAKPELTSAAMRYIDLHRQNAVRTVLLKSPQIALRLLAASVISRGGLWQARPETQDAARHEATASSVTQSKASAVFRAEHSEMRALLGLTGEGYLSAPEYGSVSLAKLFAKLLTLSDDEVLRVLTMLMAETLPAGSEAVEILGHLLAVDMKGWWTPDDAFLELLRDKPAINAMLGELAGKPVANIHVAKTAKVQKDAIRHCLAGTGGRTKVEGWLPRYFGFLMQSYTKRKGLPAVDNWNAVKKAIQLDNAAGPGGAERCRSAFCATVNPNEKARLRRAFLTRFRSDRDNAIIVVDSPGAGLVAPVPVVVGLIFRGAFELLLGDAGTVAAKIGVVFQGLPRQRVVIVSHSKEAAKTQNRVGDLARLLVDHDALDRPYLAFIGAIHGGAFNLVAADQGACLTFLCSHDFPPLLNP
jgi:ParB family chromosome partitioning protein